MVGSRFLSLAWLTAGGVPKWLRERSAKPPFTGSNPVAALEALSMARSATHKRPETFSHSLTRVVTKRERVVVHRRGKAVAALIPLEDLALLEELEDRADVQEAERRLADPNDKAIPYEQVRQELGLA